MIKSMLLTRPGLGPTTIAPWLDATNRFFSFSRVKEILVDYTDHDITIVFKDDDKVYIVEPGYSEPPHPSEIEKDLTALASFVLSRKAD